MQAINTDDIPVLGVLDSSHSATTTKTGTSALSTTRYTVVALDLDGTLLRSDHTVSDETVHYLRYLHSRGVTIVIATGRAAPSVYSTVHRLNLPKPIPVVCSNGSKGLLCMPNDTSTEKDDCSVRVVEELFSLPVPIKVVKKTLALASKLNCAMQFYHANEIYANPFQDKHYELTRMYSELTGAKTINVTDNYQALLESDPSCLPSKLLVLAPTDELGHVWATFQQEFETGEATLVYGSMGWFLEVLHPKVCKGYGLEQMCQHLKHDIGTVVAFGDGDNDIEFIQRSGRGIVMKNGRDVVKKVGDEVTNYSNNEDGVRRTLQRMEKEGSLQLT